MSVKQLFVDYFALWVVAALVLFVFLLVALTGGKPDQCQLPKGLVCTSFFATNNTLELDIANGFDEPFVVLNLENEKGGCASSGATIPPGDSRTFLFINCEHKKRLKTAININYQEQEGNLTINKTKSGSLIVTTT